MYKKNFVMLMLASILFSFGITHSMKRKKKTCTSKNIVTKKRSTGTGIIQKKQPLNGLPHQIPSLTKLCIEKVTDTFSTAFEESENGSQRIQVCQKYWDIIKNIPDKLQEEITQTIFHKLRKKKVNPLLSKKFSILLTLYETIESNHNKNTKDMAKKMIIVTCIKESGRFGVRPLTINNILTQKNWISNSFKERFLTELDDEKYIEAFTNIIVTQTKKELSNFFKLTQKRKAITSKNILGWHSGLPIENELDIVLETLNPPKVELTLKQPKMHICTTPFDKSSFIRTIRVAKKKNSISGLTEILTMLTAKIGKKLLYSMNNNNYYIVNKETQVEEISRKKICLRHFFQSYMYTIWRSTFSLTVLDEAKDIFNKSH